MFKEILTDTERLAFRKLEPTDAARLFDIYSDEDAMKYRGSDPMTEMNDAHDMITHQIKTENELTHSRCGVIEKSENRLIGTLLLKYNDKDYTRCEIGFSFDKAHWNQGYGKETTLALVNRFKKEKHFKELSAWCKKANLASIKILEQLGFTLLDQKEHPNSHLYILDLN